MGQRIAAADILWPPTCCSTPALSCPPQALAAADYVVEAVPEVESLKRQLFQQLDGLLPAHAILASNTRCLFCCVQLSMQPVVLQLSMQPVVLRSSMNRGPVGPAAARVHGTAAFSRLLMHHQALLPGSCLEAHPPLSRLRAAAPFPSPAWRPPRSAPIELWACTS